MKKFIAIFMFALLVRQLTQAQGTTYISNLDHTSTGSVAVGGDSWFAADFITGTNTAGYTLNSIQLALTDASGSPSGFTAMIYTDNGNHGGGTPGSSIGTLNGSLNPVTGGIYTYTDDASITLWPSTYYYVVLTAGTVTANGAYNWSVTSTGSPGYNNDHWGGGTIFANSSDGLNWSFIPGIYGQISLNATPAPEPSVWALLGCGGVLFLGYGRWQAKSV